MSLTLFLLEPPTPSASPWSCNGTILLFCLLYTVLFQISYRSKLFEPSKSRLTGEGKGEFHVCNVSTVNSLLVLAMTLKAAPEVLQLSDHDFYFGYSMWPDLATRCFQGFLLYDGITMAHSVGTAHVTTKQMLFHHVLFLLIAFYCTSGSYFKGLFFWLMLTEVSTPLLNFRNQMKRVGYRGIWYLINGFAFGISFGIIRVGFLGYGLFRVLNTRHIWLAKDAPVLMPWIIGLIVMAYLLMVLWFHKIILLLKKAVQDAEDGNYDEKDD